MDEAIAKPHVICRRCRYRFPVEITSANDWRLEVQCPSCDVWACFTAADTQDSPRPDEAERYREVQRLGELLWRPINANRGHPAVAWFDRVGNGLFEDDYTTSLWHGPTFWVYRFTRGHEAAYIWQTGKHWLVRGWRPLRGCSEPVAATEAFSFEVALDKVLQ